MKSELACEVAKKLLDSGDFHILKFDTDASNRMGEPWDIYLYGAWLDQRQIRTLERILAAYPSLTWALCGSRLRIHEELSEK